ncbi:TetR/AcrR family transcriptional regulator [Deinococcus taeanensis]|uniref:TetR/AcrR family transcriptional regulator n=1 Tax=Deinococcus taeanensis TaxID=2737050 RepID=UPI001CDD7E91|nr:TetR/AcrR family transcriptional regulator [Deinococcus taeanensis]UBV42357.1 TetR/AcrR family transcriptional regulator [Deinococcus taeanensis]
MTRPPDPDATTDAILDATLDVLGRAGLRGATTRAIAAQAGVNEVTLFRRYGTKAALIRAALLRQAQGLGARGVHDTGNLHHDLVTLVRAYQEALTRVGPVLGVLLTELPRHPDYLPVLDGPKALFGQVGALLGAYQARGQLRPEPLGTQLPALIGPLVLPYLLAPSVTGLLQADLPGAGPLAPDADAHVQAFLRGRAP